MLLAISNDAQLVKPKVALGILYKKLSEYLAVEEWHLVHDIAKLVWRDCGWADRILFNKKYTALYEHELVQAYTGEIHAIAKHMRDNIPIL